MRCFAILFFGLAIWMVTTASAKSDDFRRLKVTNAKRAELHWMMNCQGCHGVSGMGSPGGAPEMFGVIDKFVTVDGGRAYLASVPGVAYAPLNDDELADVLNWMLNRFVCRPLPSDFVEYDSEEVANFREMVLITNAHEVRASLIADFKERSTVENDECSNAQRALTQPKRVQ